MIGLSGWVLAQPGPNDRVARGVGPIGSWVTNGYWTLRVVKVRKVLSMADYRGLDWKNPPTPKHFEYMREHVFGRGQQVVLLDLEACHPGSGSKKLGRARPAWRLRSTQAQQVGLSGSHQNEAMNCLRTGMSMEMAVGPGQAVRPTLVFFLPVVSQPTDLFFTALRHSQDGESESLVLRLTAPSGAAANSWRMPTLPAPADKEPGGRLNPLNANGPAGAWVSNGRWRMRVAGTASLTSMAAYERLPWSERFLEKDRQKHLSYVRSKVFGADQRCWLVKVEAHNLSDRKLAFGQANPNWLLQTTLAKAFGAGSHHQSVAMWNLRQGMPRQDLVNSGQASSGILVFFLPRGCRPRHLSFSSLRHSPHGESGSLVLNLPDEPSE